MSLLEILRRNWPLKVASFIVGFTLWLHVKTDQTYERVVSLPLEIKEPSGRFVVSNEVPRTVQVRISGSGKQILVGLRHARVVLKPRVNRPESLTMDISTDDVQGLDPNHGIVVTNIEEPRSLLLDFDFLEMREAQVIPRVGIGVKPGYTVVGDVRVDPPIVRLGGPRNVIGGHLVGLFWGFVFSLVDHVAVRASLACYALDVGLSIFTLVATDTEHPPRGAPLSGWPSRASPRACWRRSSWGSSCFP